MTQFALFDAPAESTPTTDTAVEPRDPLAVASVVEPILRGFAGAQGQLSFLVVNRDGISAQRDLIAAVATPGIKAAVKAGVIDANEASALKQELRIMVDSRVDALVGALCGRDRADKAASNRRAALRPTAPTKANAAKVQAQAQSLFVPNGSEEGRSAGASCDNNLTALETLAATGNRFPTEEEKSRIAGYVGWGGVAKVFPDGNGDIAKGWEDRAKSLSALLSQEDYDGARRSILTGYYTPKAVIEWLYAALEQMGFAGGRVLEPAGGVGRFVGYMPKHLREKSHVLLVERDPVSAKIAKTLYPECQVACRSIEDVGTLADGYDLVVGNPPYGDTPVADSMRTGLSGAPLTRYFMERALLEAKDGGLVAMVVSSRFLDGYNEDNYSGLTESADLVSAIRLPSGVFSDGAGTNLSADIVVFRKRHNTKPFNGGLSWDGVFNEPATRHEINRVFDNEGGVLAGSPTSIKGPHGMRFGVQPPKHNMLRALPAVASLPKDIAVEPSDVSGDGMKVIAPDDVEVGCYFDEPGIGICRVELDLIGTRVGVALQLPKKTSQRATAMIGLREAVLKLIAMEYSGDADSDIDDARQTLNKRYDQFVKKFGYVNSTANTRAFSEDTHLPLLMALEIDYDKGVTTTVSKSTGEEVRKPSAKKAAIFTQRTIRPACNAASYATIDDGFTACLNLRGKFEADWIAEKCGVDEEAVIEELGDRVCFDPALDAYVPEHEYLSGNIGERIAALTDDPRCEGNLKRLERVMPEPLQAHDIDVQFGSTWVPANYVSDFLNERLVAPGEKGYKVVYNKTACEWFYSETGQRNGTLQTATWGTERMDAETIALASLNKRPIAIFDYDCDGNRHFNADATAAASEKAELLADEFDSWIWLDATRRDDLVERFNQLFNQIVERKYHGSHMTLPGKVDASVIELTDLQMNAIYRGVVTGRMLLDASVGFGKTYCMAAIVMERKRLGLTNTALIATPNHMVNEIAAQAKALYPMARIYAPTEKDMSRRNRASCLSRIAMCDYDIVVIGHSSVEKMPMPAEFAASFCKDEIAAVKESATEIEDMEGAEAARARRRMESLAERWESRMKRLTTSKKRYDMIDMERMGIDFLLIDEAQMAKNLFYFTKMGRVSGLGNQEGSQFAADIYMKSIWLDRITNKQGLILATATPIANSLAECHTMLRLLDLDRLKRMGIDEFDAWAATFCRVIADYELDGTGVNYALRSRMRQYSNVPELQRIYRMYAQVIDKAAIRAAAAAQGLPEPEPGMRGGKMQNIEVEPCKVQEAFMQCLVERAQSLSKGDNMLRITHEARLASIDIRLIDPHAPRSPDSKLLAMADDVAAEYRKYNEYKGTQLIFCDQATPSSAPKGYVPACQHGDYDHGVEDAIDRIANLDDGVDRTQRGSFSIYYQIKADLVDRGIPAHEIAMIHDYKTVKRKALLVAMVNSGKVRILIGSTQMMGTGMNAQKRLTGISHVDFPWRPDQVDQRNGRGLRRAHWLFELLRDMGIKFGVAVRSYATKRTYDARSLQTLQFKAGFIGQFRSGAVGRTIELMDDAATYEAMKASTTGNPVILEEVKARQTVRKLVASQRAFNRTRDRLAWTRRSKTQYIEMLETRIANTAHDKAAISNEPANVDLTALLAGSGSKYYMADFRARGFDIRLEREKGRLVVAAVGRNTYEARIPYAYGDFLERGVLAAVDQCLSSIDGLASEWTDRVARNKTEIAEIDEAAKKEWPKTAELSKARDEHRALLVELAGESAGNDAGAVKNAA